MKNLTRVLLTLLVLNCTKTIAQPTCPYPISNTKNCSVRIVYEVATAVGGCNMCVWNNVVIPANTTINVGGACCNILDVHVVILEVDGTPFPNGTQQPDVGYMGSNCIGSTAAANGQINPSSCGGLNVNLTYSNGGVTIF